MDAYQHLEFSPLDELFPTLYYAFALGFESESNSDDDLFFSILEAGLSKLTEQYPFLTRKIMRDNSNHYIFSDSTSPAPIILIRKDFTQPSSGWTLSYKQLKTSGMVDLDSRKLAPLAMGIGSPSYVMSAQVSFIPGGRLLSISFSHAFVDGEGASRIVGSWAKLCRDLQQDRSIEIRQPKYTKHPVVALAEKSDANYETLKCRPELWEKLNLDWTKNATSQEKDAVQTSQSPDPPELSWKIFSFSKDSLRNLKIIATPTTTTPNVDKPWISTHDALLAFLWRHVMRARLRSNSDEASMDHEAREEGEASARVKSTIGVAVNARKVISIPETYVSNCVFQSNASLSVQDVLTGSLTQLAQVIRLNINKTKDPGLLTDAVALASCIPSPMLLSLRYIFGDLLNEVMYTTTWVDLPFHEMDWGAVFGGQIDTFRILESQFSGINAIHPKQRDGRVEVALSMKKEHMERLTADKEFLDVASLVGRE